MSKLKIEHGVSRVKRAKLQASIDQSIADDIQLLAEWSNNEPQFVINQLLRFALTQEEDFQKHKATITAGPQKAAGNPKAKPETVPRSEQAAANHTEARS